MACARQADRWLHTSSCSPTSGGQYAEPSGRMRHSSRALPTARLPAAAGCAGSKNACVGGLTAQSARRSKLLWHRLPQLSKHGRGRAQGTVEHVPGTQRSRADVTISRSMLHALALLQVALAQSAPPRTRSAAHTQPLRQPSSR